MEGRAGEEGVGRRRGPRRLKGESEAKGSTDGSLGDACDGCGRRRARGGRDRFAEHGGGSAAVSEGGRRSDRMG